MSADTDLLKAVEDIWEASPVNASIPHERLYTDDLPGDLEMPYVQADSTIGQDPEFEAGVSRGGQYLDYRRLTVTVVGVGKKNVGDLIDLVAAAFSPDNFTAVPNSTLRACIPRGDRIEQDPRTKNGNRVYRGILEYEVRTVRTVP